MEAKLIPVVVPNLGEGIREVVVVALLRHPGDAVSENEPILQVETAKSVVDLVASCSGALHEWSVTEGSVALVGGCIGKILADSQTMADKADGPSQAATTMKLPTGPVAGLRNRQIPPRTKRLLEQHGLLDQAHLIPCRGEKLLPENIEAFLRTRQVSSAGNDGSASRPLTADEALAVRRLESNGWASHPSLTMRVDWGAVEASLQSFGASLDSRQRLVSELITWCVAQAMIAHPLFRTRLGPGNTCTSTTSAHVGIAVTAEGALPSIATIVVDRDTSWSDFQAAAERAIGDAAARYTVAHPATTVIVTNMMPFEVYVGIPSLVTPAIAVIGVGDVYLAPVWQTGKVEHVRLFNLSMTFDHRLIGGAHAAQFLHTVKGGLCDFHNVIATKKPEDIGCLTAEQVLEVIRRRFAMDLGLNPDLIPTDVPIAEMGLDSIMVVELGLLTEKLGHFLKEQFAVENGGAGKLAGMSLQDIAQTAVR